ncbi:MAG: adenylyl-sulfate kinase [Chloroflexi bacterium]|nr:adenylyl-sulfate kinase [Chloroflexota bacterium]
MSEHSEVYWQDYAISRRDRAALLDQEPLVLWFTGLSGAGKTTLANGLAKRLYDCGYATYVLDGDNLRHGLNRDLDFSVKARHENVRRMAEVVGLMYDAGLITLAACISPFKAERDFARSLAPAGRFVEVFVDTPLALCEERDNKGLYRRARAGEISDFTGIDSPFERPEEPEIAINTSGRSPGQCVDTILDYLIARRLISPAGTEAHGAARRQA